MLVFTKKKNIKDKLLDLKKGTSIGFVPTMGALHKGHLSLIEKAKRENDMVVVSIFVNPTQFDNQEDLSNYPTTKEQDLKLLETVNCDVVFMPTVEEMYEGNVASVSFNFDGLENQMEGKFREGHFNGVGTIVKALLQIIEPSKAYFGEKDYQQLQIVRKMVQKNNIDTEIIACSIFRESDGLAMSSRNIRLTNEQRKAAPFIYTTLKKVKEEFGTKNVTEIKTWVESEFKKHPLLKLEYFEIANEETLKSTNTIEPDKKYKAFIAVFADKIRLIDNISL